MAKEKEAEGQGGCGFDFLQWLGPDTSAVVFTLLGDPADLARASAVSRSWHTFVVENQFSKIHCLRLCPDVSNFTRTEITNTNTHVVGSSAAADRDNLNIEHRVYMHLTHALLSPSAAKDCINQCIGASSTDNFPLESIQNTLVPIDLIDTRPSYWSSGGHSDPAVPECLLYMLHSDLCLIHEIKIQPFRATFQDGDPIYSAKFVRLRMGYPKSPLRSQTFVSDEYEGQLSADHNYIWTYTSPEFPMLQESVLQSFKLPRPALCIGGVVKIELLGRIQKQAMDGLYYICVSHVQVVGNQLPKLGVAPSDNGLFLKYYPNPHRYGVCCSQSPGHDGHSASKWQNFATRIWHSGTARGIGWNLVLLNRLFGPPSQFLDEDDILEEEEP